MTGNSSPAKSNFPTIPSAAAACAVFRYGVPLWRVGMMMSIMHGNFLLMLCDELNLPCRKLRENALCFIILFYFCPDFK
jgi:hypothetical protein